MTLGEKIRNAREDKDLLQGEVAALIPMNQSNYSKIERGLQEPKISQLKRICEILSLDPRYLLDLSAGDILSPKDAALLRDIKTFLAKHGQS